MTATEPTEAVTGVPFTLNGTEYEAEQGELLIEACDRNGVHIPRFCYHKRMKPVGMCRMCLVEVDTGRGMKLEPSCMLPVTPEMKVETESEATKAAQDGVLELLLTNHPLDCPVCDKGGECPLQDNAYAFGPGESRFVEEKRHYEKPIPISDLVHLDRERCILCDRCTRFASDVAGDPLIHFIDRGSSTQVNTFPDHPFSSYFSGNTVQICPVGALTASPYRFKARPWDLDTVESTAMVDTTGARVLLQSSQNELVRVLGVDSEAVNWGWLSDKERFIYQASNSSSRVTEPMSRGGGQELSPVRWADGLSSAARALQIDPARVGVIGGARLTLESQYAWAKLIKGVVGSDNLDAQIGDGLPAVLTLGLPRTTIAEACAPGGIIVLIGPDPKEEQPSLYLRIRHAVTEDGATLIEVTPRATSLSDIATVSLRSGPGSISQLVANFFAEVGSVEGVSDAALAKVRSLLNTDDQISVLFGRGNLAESGRYTEDALGVIRNSRPNAKFLPMLRRGNVVGALEMGFSPGFLPGGVRNFGAGLENWPDVPQMTGKNCDGMLRAAAAGELDTLVLLGADPLDDFPDSALAHDAFDGVDTVIVVDTFMTASSRHASIFFPAAMFGEVDGTFCNLEGRLSPVRAKVTPPGLCRPDWMIAAEIGSQLGFDMGFTTLAELRSEISSTAVSFAEIDWAEFDNAEDGPLLELNRDWDLEFGEPAEPPVVASYGMRLIVDRKLWDLGTMTQEAGHLASLSPGAALHFSPTDVQMMDLTNQSYVTIDHGDISFDLPFVSDHRVPPRSAWLPARLPGFDVRKLLSAGRSITSVRVRTSEAS